MRGSGLPAAATAPRFGQRSAKLALHGRAQQLTEPGDIERAHLRVEALGLFAAQRQQTKPPERRDAAAPDTLNEPAGSASPGTLEGPRGSRAPAAIGMKDVAGVLTECLETGRTARFPVAR